MARQGRAGLGWSRGRDRDGQGEAGQGRGIKCGTMQRAMHDTVHRRGERHARLRDRADGRAERMTGQGKGRHTAVGETFCREMHAWQGTRVFFFFWDAVIENPAGLRPSGRGCVPKWDAVNM